MGKHLEAETLLHYIYRPATLAFYCLVFIASVLHYQWIINSCVSLSPLPHLLLMAESQITTTGFFCFS